MVLPVTTVGNFLVVGGWHEHHEFTFGYVELRRLWGSKERSILRKFDVQA